MNILIFGATGATGRQLVEHALAAGHSVTAFVRDPARLHVAHPSLRHVVGDVMVPPTIEPAMPGHDAVLCALGTKPQDKADIGRRQPGVPVCSVGTANIMAAMARAGVRRIVVESSASVGHSLRTGRLGAGHVVRLLLRDVMRDKEQQESLVRNSSLDWTIVRPVMLNDRPAKGRLRSGDQLAWSLASSVSRADVAAFMISTLEDRSTLGRAITVLD